MGNTDWGICGVGLRDWDLKISEVLRAQDCLYTLVVCGADTEPKARVIGALQSFLYAPEDPNAVVHALAADTMRVLTLTITEKGYCLHLSSGHLDKALPDVVHDMALLRESGNEELTRAPYLTAAAYIVAACRVRRSRNASGFTVLSCDNVQSNGDKTKICVLELARDVDREVADWIEKFVTFPNSMVDRITPATTDETRELARKLTGVEDRWPVACEDFIQWVVEDNFPYGRPPWEAAFVGPTGPACMIVDDVLPYEMMKLRLLNGGHQALAYPALLLGHRLVHEAMADAKVLDLTRAYMESATPSVPNVPGVDLASYKAKLLQRFSNAAVRDQVLRLCEDGCNRLKVAVLPCITPASSPRDYQIFAVVFACWIQYLAQSQDDSGQAYKHSPDAAGQRLVHVAQNVLAGLADVETFLNAAFPNEIGDHGSQLAATIQESIDRLKLGGAAAAIKAALGECA
eukprot:c1632_g1_i1.p1 GENE.c1632_g1_i1~~c1632_g1_i1.p1  ORF type:complete len:525 (+),score=113.97 c1632_g1_i1:194-1576(+)